MKNVLIVEDEEFLSLALKDNLTVESCTVDIAVNGDEALDRMRKKKPDLILLDLLMPKRDGFYVLEEVKKNPEWKLIPVLVLSNLGGDAEIKRALEMGADDYFVKSQHPIEEVIERVKEYLEGKKFVKPPLLSNDNYAAPFLIFTPTPNEDMPPLAAGLAKPVLVMVWGFTIFLCDLFLVFCRYFCGATRANRALAPDRFLVSG